MAVLCLMYHHTPVDPETPWDVPLRTFQAGIDALLERGIQFISLSEANDPTRLADDISVAVTFDDGHSSNAAAFEFLAEQGIRPTAFIVKAWSETRPEYMPQHAIADLEAICDFGAHGATHTGLTRLSDHALNQELHASRAYLEDVLGKAVNWMALPGGLGDARVLHAAQKAGYRLVANSIEDLNRQRRLSISRVCIRLDSDAEAPLFYATAPKSFWVKKRMHHAASGLSAMVLGEARHARAARALKALMRRA